MNQSSNSPMPSRDPNDWQALLGYLASVWPHIYAAGLAFIVALVRALHAGGRPVKSLLEAVLCGCITLSLVPVLDYFGLGQSLAVAIGAGIAFLGVEWLRERLDSIVDHIVNRWIK